MVTATLANLETARGFIRKGLHVVLCEGVTDGGHCTCGKSTCDSIGKHPIGSVHRHGHLSPITDESSLEKALKEHPYANPALVNGHNCLIVDVDRRNGGVESLQGLLVEHAAETPLPKTLENITSDGFHLILGIKGDAPLMSKLADGIDIPPYAVMPTSRHRSGHIYKFADPTQDIAPAPRWLVKLAKKGSAPKKKAAKVARKNGKHAPTMVQALPEQGLDDAGQLYDAFEARGWLGSGDGERFNARCPQNHLHSNPLPDGADPTSSTVVWTNGSFHCSHSHCTNLTHTEVRRLLGIKAKPTTITKETADWYYFTVPNKALVNDMHLNRVDDSAFRLYIVLLSLAAECRNSGFAEEGEVWFGEGEPITAEDLARLMGRSTEIILRDLSTLERNYKIERRSDGAIFVPDLKRYHAARTKRDVTNAERQARHRAKLREHSRENENKSVTRYSQDTSLVPKNGSKPFAPAFVAAEDEVDGQ